MSESTNKSGRQDNWSQISRRVFRVFASNTTFALLIVAACIIAFFLIWNRVAVSLLQEAGLPLGISDQIPVIDASYVQQVNEQRDTRINHRIRDYSRFDSVFIR